MGRVARYALLSTYYYSLFLGLLHFTYDYKTGEMGTTRFLTIYGVIVNILLMTTPAGICYEKLQETVKSKTNHLNEKIYIAMSLIRIASAFATLVLNWTHKQEIMAVIRTLQNLRQNYHIYRLPQRANLQQHFESCIVRKFFSSISNELIMLILSLILLGNEVNLHIILSLIALTIFANILNLTMNHHYFAVQVLNMHFHILNEQLEGILRQANSLQVTHGKRRHLKPHFNAMFMTKCCCYADALDELASVHQQLQKLAKRINAIFKFQGAAITLISYLNKIGVIYVSYLMVKSEIYTNAALVQSLLLLTAIVLYHYDLHLYMAVVLELLDASHKSALLLRHKYPLQLFDVHLERSVEQFLLQLAQNPLEISLLGLFKLSKPKVFAIFSTTLSSGIVLIQNDLKNGS